MTRMVLAALATALAALVTAQAAPAATTVPVWKCRASPVYTSVGANNRVEPIVANGNINTAGGADPDRAQCASTEAGAGNSATQIGIPQDQIGARTAGAVTAIVPELGKAIDQRVSASAKVEDLTVQVPAGGSTLLGVRAATADATASCGAGSLDPRLDGSTTLAQVTLGGSPIALDGLAKAIADAVGGNPLVSVKVAERIQDSTSLTIRALHVVVMPQAGGAPLLDVVVAESKAATNGPVCDPDRQGPGGGAIPSVCPPGSQLDAARGVCIIPAGAGGSRLGTIVVGLPYQGPSGGSVVPIDVARKRYGRHSPCLGSGGAPKFAIVGTERADRITGTNRADRIIGLGGNDKLDGGRGNDCIEGRKGNDNISGALGSDRLYGSTGMDHLNGGPGTDRLSGGSGNDTINAAFGRDRAIGGPGRDYINIATAGPPASANCGPGPDKVRINANERRRVRGCEVVYVFNDR